MQIEKVLFFLKNTKILNYIIYLFLLILFFLLVVNIFQFGFSQNENNLGIETEFDNCILSKIESKKVLPSDSDNKNLVFEAYDINIFPEISNFYCLNKIINISTNENSVVIYVGTNRFLFNFFNLIINSALIFVLFIDKFKLSNLFLLYLFFNLTNFYLFRSELTLIKAILPYTNPETYNEIYFFNLIFLFLLSVKAKKDIYKIFLIYILVFLIPDYLGIYVIILFFSQQNKGLILSKKENKMLFLLPIFFYLARSIYSVSKYFDKLWMFSGQRVYHGVTRFYDGIWNFEAMACIKNPNLFDNLEKTCRELSAGVLDNYVYITSDPYVTTIVFMLVMHVSLILIYLDVIKRFNFNQVMVSLIFVSPAFNFLTFQGNFDVLYLVVAYLILIVFDKNKFITSTVIFILSLYKLHTVGAVFGLLLYFYKNKNKTLINLNLIYFIISIYFALSEILKSEIVYGFGSFEFSFGLLNIVNLISAFLGISELIIFLTLLLAILLIILFISKKENFKVRNLKNSNEFYFYVLTYWFLFAMLTINNSYRLPIFFLLLLSYINSNNKILMINTLVFLFLSVVPVTTYYLIIIILNIVKQAAFIGLTITLLLIEINRIKYIFLDKTSIKSDSI